MAGYHGKHSKQAYDSLQTYAGTSALRRVPSDVTILFQVQRGTYPYKQRLPY